MSDHTALHNVSLLLVGNKIQLSRSMSTATTMSEAVLQESDPVPDDEMILDIQQKIKKQTSHKTKMEVKQKQDREVLVDDSSSSGPDEARWRAHGLARRRKILEDDKLDGGRSFSLSFDCSVERYFAVAQR